MTQSSSLPPPIEEQPVDATAPDVQVASTSQSGLPMDFSVGVQKESSRDTLIATGVLIVLAVIFFVIKNTYANWRVKERVSPSRANTSGWFLFLGLMAVAVIGTLAVLNSDRFMTPIYWGPLAVLAGISMIAWLTTYSAKN